MTRSNTSFVLRRAYERVVSSVGAIALTALMVASVDAQAATPRSVKPSVTILVPTVTIEIVEDVPAVNRVQE